MLYQCLKYLAFLSSPIIPETAEKVWRMLGFSKPLSKAKWDEIVLSAPRI